MTEHISAKYPMNTNDYLGTTMDFTTHDGIAYFVHNTKLMLEKSMKLRHKIAAGPLTNGTEEDRQALLTATQYKVDIYKAILKQDLDEYGIATKRYMDAHCSLMECVDDNIDQYNDEEYLSTCNGLMDNRNEYKKFVIKLITNRYFSLKISNIETGKTMTPYEWFNSEVSILRVP